MIELRNCPQVETPCTLLPQFAAGQKSAFCGLCQRHVHNLSALTGAEQEALLAREANPCVRYRLATPLLAAAMLLGGTQALAQDQIQEEEDQVLESLVIVGGGARISIPIFLQTELPEEFDEAVSPAPASVPAARPEQSR